MSILDLPEIEIARLADDEYAAALPATAAHAERLLASDWSALLTGLKSLHDDIARAAPDHSPAAILHRAYLRSIDNSTDRQRAAKSWAWKARALNLDPDAPHNAVALAGMAPVQIDEHWHLAIAIPQPHPDGIPSPIEDVVLINPATGKASVMGDRGATHITPPAGMVDRLPVLTDARAWARRVALDRLEWWNLRRQRERLTQALPSWSGWPSAALLLVAPAKMRWRSLSASVLEVPADMRETVRRAVLAEARLPKIQGVA